MLETTFRETAGNFVFKMDEQEAIHRAVEKLEPRENDASWRDKSSWLLRGPELEELVGPEAIQWYNTTFSTWSGAFVPFFELQYFDDADLA